MDVKRRIEVIVRMQKKVGVGQDGCERRIEVILKMLKKVGGGGGGWGQGK